ncbi:MAG TPA: class I SAM-dependent methyltransferase [Kutzneria sp.]|nr:class I SAM-dependent methyltransferase [Kutzneria sp.]
MRSLLSRLRRQPEAAPPSILDEYVTTAPSPQNAVDLFAGEWSSQLPGLSAGPIPLFADDRVEWALSQLGGVAGARVLELGPLEGGHTFMLAEAGASVLAVESQTRAYLKCLIAKELLGMPAARFVLGDFMAYLRETDEHFDLVFASGVLYHMRTPVETIALMARAASSLFLWTHYYDEEIVRASPLLSPRFTSASPSSYEGLEHTLHRFEYESALQLKGFCGGSAPHSNWLSRADLMAALEHFGWQVKAVAFDTPDHPHGPALALVATKS